MLILAAFVPVLMLICMAGAWAGEDTTTISICEDVWIDGDIPSTNLSLFPRLDLGPKHSTTTGAKGSSRVLMRWDLSSLAGKTASRDAIVELWISAGLAPNKPMWDGFMLEIYRPAEADGDWNENSVTWQYKDQDNQIPWTDGVGMGAYIDTSTSTYQGYPSGTLIDTETFYRVDPVTGKKHHFPPGINPDPADFPDYAPFRIYIPQDVVQEWIDSGTNTGIVICSEKELAWVDEDYSQLKYYIDFIAQQTGWPLARPALQVITAEPLGIDQTLADGIEGIPYADTVDVTGFDTPTFSVSAGSLPAGLSLDANSGMISGTPTAAGFSTFTITAQEGADLISQEYTVEIKPLDFSVATGVKVSWQSVPGYVYQVEWSANGSTGWTAVSPELPGHGEPMRWVDTSAGLDNPYIGFYRVVRVME